jgi:hypothetical protein
MTPAPILRTLLPRPRLHSFLCRPALAAAWILASAWCFAQQARFDILKGNTVVGSVTAMKAGGPERTTYLMTSYSEFDMVWKQVVRTTAVTEYDGEELAACRTSVTVNNAVRDSSHMARGADRCYVHPAKPFACAPATRWTTARMYFEEPVDQASIFVESVLRECRLERLGDGLYKLTIPDKGVSHYAYKDGVLQEIRVDRSLFDLVFRRA